MTAALLEQADTNLDSIRDDIELDRPAFASSRIAELSAWDAQRFVQADRESVALDRRVASALDLKIGHVPKSGREFGRAAALAGWETYAQMRAGVQECGALSIQLAIACADTAHGVVLIDYERAEPPMAFKGVGLYWVALAVGLGINDVDPFGDHVYHRDPRWSTRRVQVSRQLPHCSPWNTCAEYPRRVPGSGGTFWVNRCPVLTHRLRQLKWRPVEWGAWPWARLIRSQLTLHEYENGTNPGTVQSHVTSG